MVRNLLLSVIASMALTGQALDVSRLELRNARAEAVQYRAGAAVRLVGATGGDGLAVIKRLAVS